MDGGSLKAFAGTLAIDIFDHYTKTEDADLTVRKLLEMTGVALGVSRALVFEKGAAEGEVKLTYSWAADNPDGVTEENLRFNYAMWASFLPIMDADGLAAVDDDMAEPLLIPFRDYLTEHKVASSMECYYSRAGEVCGSIYVDYLESEPHRWTGDEKDLLVTVAKIFSTYLYNMRQLQHTEEEHLLLHAIDKNQDLYTYILKDGTHEILYLSDNIRERFPHARPGDTCYRVFQLQDTPCEGCPISSEGSNRAEIFSNSLKTWISISATRIRLAGGEPATLICVSDIAGFKARIDGLDALTAIPTLPMFRSQAEAELAGSGDSLALCYFDFDSFGSVNDKKGISAADQLLKDFAAFIQSRLHPGELVCRYFSDVFLVLVRAETVTDVRIRAREFYNSLSDWAAAYFDNPRLALKCGACVQDNGEDLESMIAGALAAKESLVGQGGYALFNAQMRDRSQRRRELEGQLAAALKADEFSAYYQPGFDLKTNRIAGAEACPRWRRADGKLVPPEEFLPLLDKNGLRTQADSRMVEQALLSIKRWRAATGQIIPVALPIAEESLRDPAFVEYTAGMLRESDLPRYTLQFILQEGMFSQDADHLVANIRALRTAGVAFLIDDLGRGPSRLNILRDLPVDILKIDNEFFGHVHLSEQERSTLSHIIRLAKSMDMKVLLTGVTAEDQVDMLREVNGDFAQGPLFGPPMKAEDLQKLLEGENAQA